MKPFVPVLTILDHLGYDIFTYFGESTQVACFKDGKLYFAQIFNAVRDQDKNKLVRLRDRVLPNTDFICIADVVNLKVWIIPNDSVGDLSSIRLGRRWDCYKYNIHITSDIADENKQNYVSGVKEAIEKLTGVKDDKANKE